MSAHNVLENQLVADHTLVDLKNLAASADANQLVVVDRTPSILLIETGADNEVRYLPVPEAAGLSLTIVFSVDVGGNVDITQDSNVKFTSAAIANTKLTGADAGSVVLSWRIVNNDGFTLGAA
jgi:hypothetical protein